MALWLEPSEDNRRAAERRVRRWTTAFHVMTRPILRLEVVGAESLPKEGPALVVANHANLLDPFLGIAAVGRPVHWFGTATLQQKGPVARFLRDSGAIPKQRFKKDLLAVRLAMRWAKVGGVVGVFPEGERSWDGRVQRFVPGVGGLVRALRVPVFGLRMENAHRHWPRFSARPRRGVIRVHVERVDLGTDPEAAIQAVVTPQGCEHVIRSWNAAQGMSQLVYACPECGAQAMTERRGALACGACQQVWRVDTAHRLTGPSEHTLSSCMDAQQAAAIAAWQHTRPDMVLRSGRTTWSTPSGSFEGHGVLRPDRLEVVRGGQVCWSLPMSAVRHANVEFQRRFEVHTDAGMVRADLPVTDSGWRWGWTTRWFASNP